MSTGSLINAVGTLQLAYIGDNHCDVSTGYAIDRWHITKPPMMALDARRSSPLETFVTVVVWFVNDMHQWRRNAILPVVTLAGLQAGQLVGGAVLTETVFAWPGIGRLMFESLAARDYNTLLGVFLVSAAMVILFNVITDIAYRLIDPRIAAGGAA